MNYKKVLNKKITDLKREGRYREFICLERQIELSPRASNLNNNSDQVTVWCSNDYLSSSHRKEVVEAMTEATTVFGTGAGGTRNISGTSSEIVKLESTIASHLNRDAALVLSSGYVANECAISTLGKIFEDLVIFSDEENHASIIQGINLGRIQKQIYRHIDTEHLESLLSSFPYDQPKLIVFESVYSMSGDFSPLEKIIELADKYNALTYIDETHSYGLYGESGAGYAEQQDVVSKIDIIQGGLGKAIGTFGGFIAGDIDLIDCIRSYGAGFIFTTALPPSLAAAARVSIEQLRDDATIREKFFAIVEQTKIELEKEELPFIKTTSHIIPLIVGDASFCKYLSDKLLAEYQIYLQPINYPTVPRGTERFRITPNFCHSVLDARLLATSLRTLFEKERLINAAKVANLLSVSH